MRIVSEIAEVELVVGAVFYTLRPKPVRHQVRAIVDGRVVHRCWQPHRQRWYYECDWAWSVVIGTYRTREEAIARRQANS